MSLRRWECFQEFEFTAVLVEPRVHPALEFVLDNFATNLDERWGFVIFHGNNNKQRILDIIDKFNQPERFTLVDLQQDNLSIEDYNALLLDKGFYEHIPTEIFLIFQMDTIICPENAAKLYDFLQYDYIGAPWVDRNVGNGGLSLRRKSKMLEILDTCTISSKKPEDVQFAFGCENALPYKPDYDIAKGFSMESVDSTHENPFGHHASWRYHDPETLSVVADQCTGYDTLRQL
jgi:hypothetical protein